MVIVIVNYIWTWYGGWQAHSHRNVSLELWICWILE